MPPRSSDSGVLQTLEDGLYRLVYDDAWNTLTLFGLAALMGLTSIVVFWLSPGSGPTTVEILLQVAAAAILFYLALTHGQR